MLFYGLMKSLNRHLEIATFPILFFMNHLRKVSSAELQGGQPLLEGHPIGLPSSRKMMNNVFLGGHLIEWPLLLMGPGDLCNNSSVFLFPTINYDFLSKLYWDYEDIWLCHWQSLWTPFHCIERILWSCIELAFLHLTMYFMSVFSPRNAFVICLHYCLPLAQSCLSSLLLITCTMLVLCQGKPYHCSRYSLSSYLFTSLARGPPL